MLESSDLVFYILGVVTLVAGLGVITIPNPIYSALSLVITMVCVGGIFWSLGAFFVAAVQLAVYAGAVTVLFVMVLMLFDLKQEKKAFSPGLVFGFLKMIGISLFLGVMGRVIYLYSQLGLSAVPSGSGDGSVDSTRELSGLLFSKYVFGFEAISILLLLVVIGAVSLSRIKGGTHADS